LVRGGLPQQRFGLRDISQDPGPLFGGLAERIVRATLHPVHDDIGWCGEEHDRGESVVEAPLIGHSALNEQGLVSPLLQQLVDQRFAPEWLAVDDLDPGTVVGVDGGIAPPRKFGQRRRLPDPGHTCHENRRVVTHTGRFNQRSRGVANVQSALRASDLTAHWRQKDRN
jgi:hypothetical protein